MIRQQAVGIQALLALIEWGDSKRAGRALGVPRQTIHNRLQYLYGLLEVHNLLNATLLLWPLIQDVVVVRDRNGRALR